MDTTCWHMNATLWGGNLHPGVNLHPGANLHPGPGANCAYEHGFNKTHASCCCFIRNAFVKNFNGIR